jgi:hypothetical protein
MAISIVEPMIMECPLYATRRNKPYVMLVIVLAKDDNDK